ncbi:unannotated protein [freshwater metagenome]|uniref:Unannotated protein n=1 Tax=freshwater metagenome TaxID=449393 RepID=A0A6J7GSF8_9ZZZZ|nr:hypothetical protein [Actinomycetota bacterium]
MRHTAPASPRQISPSRRALLALLVLLASAVPLLVAAPHASALSKGLMDENLPRNDDPTQRAEFFDVAKRANVKFVRTYIQWEGKTSTPAPHEIDSIIRYALEAKVNGIDTVFIGFNGLIAADEGGGFDDARDISLKRYRLLVQRSVAALKPLQAAGVRLVWEPMNEANIYTLFPKKNGPEVWRKMQNIAYEEVKEQTPDAMVVAGELAPYARNPKSTNPGTWVQRALGLDARFKPKKGTRAKDYAIKADGWTLHSYDYKVDPAKTLKSDTMWTIRNVARTRAILRKIARTSRVPRSAVEKVYITEFAYIAEGGQSTSEENAAKWTRKAWEIAKKNKLRGFLWFQVRDPKDIFYSGLKTIDGDERKVFPVFLDLK